MKERKAVATAAAGETVFGTKLEVVVLVELAEWAELEGLIGLEVVEVEFFVVVAAAVVVVQIMSVPLVSPTAAKITNHLF